MRKSNLNTSGCAFEENFYTRDQYNVHLLIETTAKIKLLSFVRYTSGKLFAVPFWDGCCDTGGPVAELEKELGVFKTGFPLPLGCGCPASFSSCNSCVSLNL